MENVKSWLRDSTGEVQEVELSLEMYKEAEEIGLSLPQLLNQKYAKDTNPEVHGNAFDQLMMAAGLFLSEDNEYGIRPPTLDQVLKGSGPGFNMNAIVRPDGQNALSPSGRLLFPAVVLSLIESELRENNGAYASAFQNLVATTLSVPTPRYDQPVINLSGPRNSKSRPIAQLAEPNRMIGITLSETTKRMPLFSIGLEISDEAARAATLDLVAIAIREQSMQERADQVDEAIRTMVLGDVDAGMAPLQGDFIDAYDPAITTAGKMTQKAWVKWLRSKWKKRNLDWVITDLDTYLAIEGREGRPQFTTGLPTNDERLNSIPQMANKGIDETTRFFIVEDGAATLGATGVMVGLDSRNSIRRVIYTGAQYEAVQQFVMRRSTAFRFDWSERYERVGFDESWQKTTLAPNE